MQWFDLTISDITAKAKAKKIGKVGPIAEKITLPVETDVNKLVNYVCGSNIYEVGKDIKVKKIFLEIVEIMIVTYTDIHIILL